MLGGDKRSDVDPQARTHLSYRRVPIGHFRWGTALRRLGDFEPAQKEAWLWTVTPRSLGVFLAQTRVPRMPRRLSKSLGLRGGVLAPLCGGKLASAAPARPLPDISLGGGTEAHALRSDLTWESFLGFQE